MINEAGLSDFHALQGIIGRRRPSPDLYLVAFDLMLLNGHDLRAMPLADRREILQGMIPEGGGYSSARRCQGLAMQSIISSTRPVLKVWCPS
ncbi:hypothetical protein [Mesorhizobium sp. B2-1-3A]|uniref:hypothetical protein n=1 Tax=Mesorhizobium sp. B2-1-3A TaxID=2589971 RepID=UPI0032B26C0F